MNPSEDPLYLEAVEVYKKLQIESVKVERAGGAPTLPPAVAQYVTAEYAKALAAQYSDMKKADVRMDAELSPTVKTATNPGIARGGSLVSLRACLDGTTVPLRDGAGKELGKGNLILETVFFVRQSGVLVIADGEASEVETCPLA